MIAGTPSRPLRGWPARLRPVRSVTFAAALAIAMVAFAVLAPVIAGHDPVVISLADRLQGPSWEHWLGTDHLGRDMLARLAHGARISLGTVAVCLALILVLGVAIGGLSGFIGGRFDQVAMRFCDVFLTFPTIVLALFMIGVLGTGMVNVILAIALSHWAWYARMVRGIVLSLREREYVLAARAAGATRLRLFIDHLLPAIAAPLVVLASLDIGHMLLHVAGLSFLGLGVVPPAAEWGVMISDARQFVWTQPMLLVWPGLALLLTVMAFNRLGDALRDRLDPALMAGHHH